MAPLLLLLHLAACWTPRDTGPDSMVGVILDATGAPIPNLQVETIEARWTTDAEGRFAVNYKEPSQWLEFQHEGVRFRRFYRPEDDGKDIAIRVPEMAPVRVACEMDANCNGTLKWTLDDGLVAQVAALCDREEPQVVDKAPAGAPGEATCRVGPADPDQPAKVRVRDGGLLVTPPLVPLRVELKTHTEKLPNACDVFVDDVPAATVDDGAYKADVFGYTTVKATCDRIPATPKRVYTRGEATIDLLWTPEVPRLVLPEKGPISKDLVLAQIAGVNGGWTLQLQARDDGSFLLPPLGPGTYAFGVNMQADRVALTRPVTELRPRVLHWRPLDKVVWVGDMPEALGVLVLEDELLDGDLPVQVYGSNPP